jgi:electron transport complex protein RnfB
MFLDPYRRLQKHLNSLPVGFPRTLSGVEIRLLKGLFEPIHARVALAMSFKPERAAVIYERINPDFKEEIGSLADLTALLREMGSRGTILYSRKAETYALVPFIIGMYEFQLKRLNSEFLNDTLKFGFQGYGLEFLTTSQPQTRTIPLDIKIDGGQKVATYDEYRRLIKEADGHIAVLPCICRSAADIQGNPCTQSDERELCLALRDYADMSLSEGLGRSLTVEEALDLAERSLKSGLVLQSSNDQNPQFICACCSDCCGLLGMFKASPSPAEHIASTYRVQVNTKSCLSCGKCVKRCPMEALHFEGKVLIVDRARCIGCGVCTPVCPAGSLVLTIKENSPVPPETMVHLHEILARDKSGPGRKAKLAVKIGTKMVKEAIQRKI